MSHDPLCKHRSARMPVNGCPSCDEIANIRADEREKAAQRVESCVNKFKARDYNDAVDACVAAVRGES